MRKEPIRIAHVMGKMNSGGVETFVMNLYKYIDKNSIQFDFLVDEDSTRIPIEEIERYGGRIIKVPAYQNLFLYLKKLKAIFLENNYQIVHSHLNALSLFPLYSAFCAKIPIRIAHSHSTSNKKEWKKDVLKNLLKPFSKMFATDYFACSEHAGRWLFGDKIFENGKVKIIHNAIDIEKFKFDMNIRNKIRGELNVDDKLVFGHVGRFMEQKNHEFLINLFYEINLVHKNSILILVGEGPLEFKIRDKVKELGLEDNVYFMGARNDVHEILQAMDVFLFPSLYEGLGIVAIESQISGLKVICSKEVPKEVDITKNVDFLNLDIDEWKNIAVSCNKKRCNFFIEEKINLYDMKKEVKRYQDLIYTLLEERIKK